MTPLYVQVPTPCAESWAAMTPTGTGRHCAACQKTVVDFTQQTDAEILAYLARSSSHACGRLRADQLARPLQPVADGHRPRPWLRVVLALGSLGALLGHKAAAQTIVGGSAGPVPMAASPAQEPVYTPSSPAKVQPALRPGSSRNLSGIVREGGTQSPLPGVTVLLKGTTLGTSTDVNGAFTLTVPGDSSTMQLSFQYIGYTTIEQTASTGTNAPFDVVLQPSGELVMGVIVTGINISQRRPWPWHPRALFNRSKYLVARALGR